MRTAEQECKEGPATEDQCPFAEGVTPRRIGWHTNLIAQLRVLKTVLGHRLQTTGLEGGGHENSKSQFTFCG